MIMLMQYLARVYALRCPYTGYGKTGKKFEIVHNLQVLAAFTWNLAFTIQFNYLVLKSSKTLTVMGV